MKNYIAEGDVIQVDAPANVSSGDGVLVGQFFGIATTTEVSGDPVQIKTTGVVDITKVSAQAWTVGAAIYWDDAADNATTVATGIQIGVATAVAANPTPTGRVRLNGFLQPAYASY